jgi:predicted lipoprotein with Yx(FWY)xxD motif
VFRLTVACLAAAALIVGCGDDSEPTEASANGTSENAAVTQERTVQEDEPAKAQPAAKRKKGAVVKVVDSQFGRVVADRKGEALYLFDKEKGKRSQCYGQCAVAWPPLLTKGKPRAGDGARKGLLGTTRRRDGKLQVTYAGHPLYYYVDDAPGRILCHNVDEFGGLWLVVKPNGSPVS